MDSEDYTRGFGEGYDAAMAGRKKNVETMVLLERERIIKLLNQRTIDLGHCCSKCTNDSDCCDWCEKDCEDDFYSPLEALEENARTTKEVIALIKGENK